MPYANREDRNRNQRERYALDPAPQLAATKAWVQKNPTHVRLRLVAEYLELSK